jgi:hypothetical protein
VICGVVVAVPVASLLAVVTVIAVETGVVVNREVGIVRGAELVEGTVRGAELVTVVLEGFGLGLVEVFGLMVVAVSVVLSAEVSGFVAHCRLDLVMLLVRVSVVLSVVLRLSV